MRILAIPFVVSIAFLLPCCDGGDSSKAPKVTEEAPPKRRAAVSPEHIAQLVKLVEAAKTREGLVHRKDVETNLAEVLRWSADHTEKNSEWNETKIALFYKLVGIEGRDSAGKQLVSELRARYAKDTNAKISDEEIKVFLTESIDPKTVEAIIQMTTGFPPGLYLKIADTTPRSAKLQLYYEPENSEKFPTVDALLSSNGGQEPSAELIKGAVIPNYEKPIDFSVQRSVGKDLSISVRASNGRIATVIVPPAEDPNAAEKAEIARIKSVLKEKEQELSQTKKELRRWQQAKITLTGYDDTIFNTNPGDGGVWEESKTISVGNVILIPNLGVMKSNLGTNGNDRWSSVIVSVSIPEN